MGFLDKAKVQAQTLQGTVVEKASTLQRDRRVGKLIEELGALAFLELAGRSEPIHASRLEALRAELIAAEADGAKILWTASGQALATPAPHQTPPPPPLSHA
ncbi:MAG TPA: hypothetical protein VGP53_05875, partial [Acidimicrobiales bacterium]|nr:hypothetical protein [Acidimicrobiales bacterium]